MGVLNRASVTPSRPSDDERKAAWLLSPYSSNKWLTRDTSGLHTTTIDLELRMPDGRPLSEHTSLFATVKEYAFWCREDRYTEFEDADTQKMHVRALMIVAYFLSSRGIESFEDVTALDIDAIAEAARWGADALTGASRGIVRFLGERRDDMPAWPRSKSGIDWAWAIAGANLPVTSGKYQEVAAVLRYADPFIKKPRKVFDPPLKKPRRRTIQAVGRYLFPMEHLYEMRRVLCADTLRFRPFPEGASALATRLGVTSKRTPTPEPPLALAFMGRTMSWIVLNGENIVTASRSHSASCQSMMVRNHDGVEESILISMGVKLLTTACLVVAATFSARRLEELEDLTRDCLLGEEGNCWLHCYILKTYGRKEAIPIPDMVAKAIQLVLDLTEGSDDDRLFQRPSIAGVSTGYIVGKDKPSRRINMLAHHLGVDRDPKRPEEPWVWSTHQFRRFFAILYFHRYGGEIEALSHHLRHFDLDMTRRYVMSDPETAAIFMSYEWGYLGDLARSIAYGTRVPRGGMDKHLDNLAKRIRADFRKNLQVVEPERVAATLALAMRRKSVIVTPQRWGDCMAPKSALGASRAACRSASSEEATGADRTKSAPEVCFWCPWSSVGDGQARNIIDDLQWEIAKADEPSRRGTMLAMLEEERLLLVWSAYKKVKASFTTDEGGSGKHGQ